MGRPFKKPEERKVKFGICVSPELFYLLSQEKISKSKLIERLISDYYEKNNRKIK